MSLPSHTLFLVPGFFGFTNLAGIEYFAQVRAVLARRLAALGTDVRIIGVKTLPTSALPRRAARLATTIIEEAPTGPIHIVGHSTGGLDARLLAHPDTVLDEVTPAALVNVQDRLRSIVAVATPHRGTPLAAFFAGRAGEELMKLLSVMAVHVSEVGPVPMALLEAVTASLGAIAEGLAGPNSREAVVSATLKHLLSDFDPVPRQVVSEFFEWVWQDQSLIPQLTPAAVAAMSSDWRLPDHVHAGSVVIQARRPGLAAMSALGLDPMAQALHLIFRFIQRQSKWTPPSAVAAVLAPVRQCLGEDLHADGNDGIVPTASQVWQTLIGCAWADHLDVVGHFHAPDHIPPHFDWLPSGSRYRRAQFVALWDAVADFIADSDSGHASTPALPP